MTAAFLWPFAQHIPLVTGTFLFLMDVQILQTMELIKFWRIGGIFGQVSRHGNIFLYICTLGPAFTVATIMSQLCSLYFLLVFLDKERVNTVLVEKNYDNLI